MIRVRGSLQARLVALVLGAVVAVWLVTVVATWSDARHEIDELLDSHLAQAAALLVVQQATAEGEHAPDAPTLHRYAPKVSFQVFHAGRLVLRSANAPTAALASAPGDGDGAFSTVRVDGVAWRVFAARGGEADVQVYVGERETSRSAILRAVLRSVLWPMALALPLLALVVWGAVRYGTVPLRTLGRALASRDPRALEPLDGGGAPAEIVPMVEALNRLFVRIGSMIESERRFTADAAHELRTPIAAVRAQAQVALAAADDSERRRAIQGTLEGCDRATRLVEQLLVLSRLEGAQVPADAGLVDLADTARRVLADVAPAALARGQRIGLDAEASAMVHGDAALLAVLARNLIDNAVRYAPRGAEIRVSVGQRDGRVELRVEDGGPGLAPADLARLGERFFRVPGSGEAGSGLGWSIVRRIAAAHGAELAARRSAALGGLEVSATWPAASAAEAAAIPRGTG